MSTSKIRTLVKRKYYWSTMRPWRCTSQTEYYGNLDIDNRFPWHLSRTTSKCGKIGMIIYLLKNRSSFWS
ncbi:hypothetical protein Goklo_029097 [Gossypium klotzschianum]|uniref:Uncharacterized protein n=1 Tax=Gossypium klotzschianum TaxID=34286 RepID=A0A7J8W479_9ROSI|nr:hypothetical protein [Gossypium klotzschianum]